MTEISAVDFISLMDAMEGIEYDLANLLILLKKLIVPGFSKSGGISVLTLVNVIDEYDKKEEEAMEIQRNRKKHNVNRRRQSWVEKHGKNSTAISSNNISDHYISGSGNSSSSSSNTTKIRNVVVATSNDMLLPPPPPPPVKY